ncbi:MAG TPA: aldehyde dehydrogenase family protein [Chthoniobacteraceae bacterium]|jgi:aldehyde dehydrogenase|nr:aldehyde dehydrogenase family protein [Chthoniobacteraceae bacterium]
MNTIDPQLVSKVVSEVLARLQSQTGAVKSGETKFGVYEGMNDAAEAAHRSFEQLRDMGVTARKKAIAVIRRMCVAKAEEWGAIEFRETKIGRLDHKIEKLKICGDLVPGVEMLERMAFSGDYGLTIIDFAPWGVIGAVTPSTHSVPTLTGNAINMIAAGNAVVFNTHPAAANCAAIAIRGYNEAIFQETGISDLLTTVVKPTLGTFDEMCKHPKVRLLCVTGGPAVVAAAMKTGKRAICAGPGNPPVVVDETADLASAARSIIQGGSYDNNLLCIGEKEVFVVEAVADKLIAELKKAGAFQLDASQIEALTKKAFVFPEGKGAGCGHASVNRDLVGRDAAVLAQSIGLHVPPATQLLFGETSADHIFVEEEQMMPFMPIVRVPNVDVAIKEAIRAEHHYRHTAIMHSQNIRNLTRMAQDVDTTLFIKNGPSMTGLGLGGEGFLSFSVATPTGEGVTTPMTFTRSRRCVMVESLNLY